MAERVLAPPRPVTPTTILAEQLNAARRGEFHDTRAVRQEEPLRVDLGAPRSVHADRMPPGAGDGRRERVERPLAAVGHRARHEVSLRIDVMPPRREMSGGGSGRDGALEAVEGDDDAHARVGVLSRRRTSSFSCAGSACHSGSVAARNAW